MSELSELIPVQRPRRHQHLAKLFGEASNQPAHGRVEITHRRRLNHLVVPVHVIGVHTLAREQRHQRGPRRHMVTVDVRVLTHVDTHPQPRPTVRAARPGDRARQPIGRAAPIRAPLHRHHRWRHRTRPAPGLLLRPLPGPPLLPRLTQALSSAPSSDSSDSRRGRRSLSGKVCRPWSGRWAGDARGVATRPLRASTNAARPRTRPWGRTPGTPCLWGRSGPTRGGDGPRRHPHPSHLSTVSEN